MWSFMVEGAKSLVDDYANIWEASNHKKPERVMRPPPIAVPTPTPTPALDVEKIVFVTSGTFD